jgi:hypothetical protein
VQQLALQLELLVVVHCVQNVGSDLQQVRNYLRICVLLWPFINLSQQVVVPLVRLFLERVVLVDFVGLEFQQPAHGFGLDVKLFVFVGLERVHSVWEHFVIVYFLVVFGEQKLGGVGVFFGIDMIELDPELIILKDLFLDGMIFVLDVFGVGFDEVRGNVVLGDEIVLFHHHR